MERKIRNLIRKKMQALIREEKIGATVIDITKKILRCINDSKSLISRGAVHLDKNYRIFKIAIFDKYYGSDDGEFNSHIAEINRTIDEYALVIDGQNSDDKTNVCDYITYAKFLIQILKSKGFGEDILGILDTRTYASSENYKSIIITIDIGSLLDYELAKLAEEDKSDW